MPAHAGRYELVSPLGKGSMGEVWRAVDPRIGRPVAVKLLRPPDGMADGEAAEWDERFLREARAAGRLSHPGIVPVHDAGTTEEGRRYLVMELVDGRSLEQVLREEGPLPASRALAWGARIAEALDAAHRKGVVHRDLKPANVLIDEEGNPRLVDFGIARCPGSDLTREGIFLGSPAFSSPEQIRGEGLDGRSDIFSLGAVLYNLLSGVRPFTGADLPSLAYAICHTEPAPLDRLVPALSREAITAVSACLAKNPAMRFQTGSEAALALRAAAGLVVNASARPEPPLRRAARQGADLWRAGWRRGPVARVAMMSVLVLLVTIAVRVPAALGRPISLPAGSTEDPAALEVRVMHALANGDVTIWAEGRKVLHEDLRREESGGGVWNALTGWRRQSDAWIARVPPGVSRLRVKVDSRRPDFEVEREVACDPVAGTPHTLEIRVRAWPSARVSMECLPAPSP